MNRAQRYSVTSTGPPAVQSAITARFCGSSLAPLRFTPRAGCPALIGPRSMRVDGIAGVLAAQTPASPAFEVASVCVAEANAPAASLPPPLDSGQAACGTVSRDHAVALTKEGRSLL